MTPARGSIWERPEPPGRPAPAPLSRDAIVRAAIALADAGGLAAVSLRRVAATLDAGPMRLYGYLATKDELLDLMADAVHAEIPLPRPGTPWRTALRNVAEGTRAAALRHPWFTDLLGGRPHLGPGALETLEASLTALLEEFGPRPAREAADTLNAWLAGTLRREIAERGEDHRPYRDRMLATGRYPAIAAVSAEAREPGPEVAFRAGLERILDAIGQA